MSNYTTPVVLKCNVTGREQKLYHRPYIDKLIEKYGSLEELLANYTAKGAVKKSKTTTVTPVVVSARVSARDSSTVSEHANFIHTCHDGGLTSDGDKLTINIYESKN